MNPKYMKAIMFYMRGMTKKESLLKAGFSESVANSDAHSIFEREDVKAEIERRQEAARKRHQLDEDWIIERLMAIADANLGELLEFDEEGYPRLAFERMTPEMKYALGGLKLRSYSKGRGKDATPVTEMQPQMIDKLRAIEMLGKYLKMFKEQVEVNADADTVEILQAARKRKAAENRGDDGADGTATADN